MKAFGFWTPGREPVLLDSCFHEQFKLEAGAQEA